MNHFRFFSGAKADFLMIDFINDKCTIVYMSKKRIFNRSEYGVAYGLGTMQGSRLITPCTQEEFEAALESITKKTQEYAPEYL